MRFLTLSLFGISNSGGSNNIDNKVFAQGDGMMMGNGTGGMMNATLATSGTMNATLAFAQENDIISMKNDTSMMIMNATLPTSIISNATLAYAQEGEMMEMEEDMMMTMTSNQSKEEMKMNWTWNN